MYKWLSLCLALVLASNLAYAELFETKDYTKRNEAYLRDVKKRDANINTIKPKKTDFHQAK